MNEYITGTTIRITAVFTSGITKSVTDLDAEPIVNLYTPAGPILQGTSTRSSTGTYYYDLALPTTPGFYTYEFAGLYGGNAVVGRQTVNVQFVNEQSSC